MKHLNLILFLSILSLLSCTSANTRSHDRESDREIVHKYYMFKPKGTVRVVK